MYFFVQIERALLREGLEADGALERPLPCAANARTRGDRETKQNHDGQIILLSSVPIADRFQLTTMREFYHVICPSDILSPIT